MIRIAPTLTTSGFSWARPMWLAKNLSFLANADAAGIVLGARVPIILTSRADSVRTRMASCAIASLYADARRRAVAPPAE